MTLHYQKMIEIDYHLLSELAIENLIMAMLTREATDYSECKMEVADKKDSFLPGLSRGMPCLFTPLNKRYCTIVPVEEKQK